jgi:hypothetical protein
VWFTVDGGQTWTQLKGGIPNTQARDLAIHRREADLIVGTFGRGAFILDDYSALRELTPQALTDDAKLLPVRDAYLFEELGQQQAAWGNMTTPNPPVGAVFTYTVAKPPEGDAKLVLTITDDGGRQVRRLDVAKNNGLNRATWNLRGEPPAGEGRGSGRGGRGGTVAGGDDPQPAPAFGGRGGPAQGPLVAPGRYRAALGRQSGDTVTPIGQSVSFQVVPLPR